MESACLEIIQTSWCEAMAVYEKRLRKERREAAAAAEKPRESCTTHRWDTAAADMASTATATIEKSVVVKLRLCERWLPSRLLRSWRWPQASWASKKKRVAKGMNKFTKFTITSVTAFFGETLQELPFPVLCFLSHRRTAVFTQKFPVVRRHWPRNARKLCHRICLPCREILQVAMPSRALVGLTFWDFWTLSGHFPVIYQGSFTSLIFP